MAELPHSDDLTLLTQRYEHSPSGDLLQLIGTTLLNQQGENDGKLLFMMQANLQQWNSSIADPSAVPVYIGVYASTIRKECSMNPGNHTVSHEKPSIVIHEAKKFLHYLVHFRPAMIELLFTNTDHYWTPEWEILRQNTKEIVSTQLASKYLQIVIGNVDNMCHPKYKRQPQRIWNTFYVATRLLDAVEKLVRYGELGLQLVSEDYLKEVMTGKFDLDALVKRSKDRIADLEVLLKENAANLISQPNLDYLNDWLLEQVRRPTL